MMQPKPGQNLEVAIVPDSKALQYSFKVGGEGVELPSRCLLRVWDAEINAKAGVTSTLLTFVEIPLPWRPHRIMHAAFDNDGEQIDKTSDVFNLSRFYKVTFIKAL
jgi:hypothetical protein